VYAFLLRFLPEPLAVGVLAGWYTLLLVLIYLLSGNPQGVFRYLDL